MEKEKGKEKPKRSVFRKTVNVFIGIFVFLIVLVILLIGFSQTATFRSILKDKIISLVESGTNGKISIGAIDGTILTSVYVRDLILTVQKDTLASVKKIELKVSPLQLFIGKLYIREIEVKDVFVSFLQDSAGYWNIEKFIKPTEEPEKKEKFSLPFALQVNQLNLTNINFRKQSYSYLNSRSSYSTVNMDDFRLNDFNLSSRFFLDTDSEELSLLIDNISADPNFKAFDLKEFSGWIEIRNDYAEVRDLRIKTLKSDVRVTARLDSINLFSGVELEDFKNYPMKVTLEVNSFYFDDLSSFLEDTYFLKGVPGLSLDAEGRFGNFKINSLIVDYLDTHLDLSGSVKNLHTPDNLFIDVTLSNSKADYENVTELLPFLKLPEFKKLAFTNFDAEFIGEPTNFKSRVVGETEEGYINLDAELNLAAPVMIYNVDILSENINLRPILSMDTDISAEIKIKGRGTTPNNLNTVFELKCQNSKLEDITINSLQLNGKALSKIISFDLKSELDAGDINLSGRLDFNSRPSAGYTFAGSVHNFNLSEILRNPEQQSDINLNFSVYGTDLDPNETNAKMIISIDSTSYNSYSIDKTRFILSLLKEGNKREIDFNSSLADITLEGEFSPGEALDLLLTESQNIGGIISEKIDEFKIIDRDKPANKLTADKMNISNSINKNIEIEYRCKFKDLKLLSKIIRDSNFDIVGELRGGFKNDSSNFSISSELSFDHFLFSDKENIFYASDFIMDLNFSRNKKSSSFDDLFGSLSITGERLDAGSKITDISADCVFNQGKVFFNLSAALDTIAAGAVEGIAFIKPRYQSIDISNLSLIYKDVEWKNKDSIKIVFTPDAADIKKFNLTAEGAEMSVDGSLLSTGKQKFDIDIKELSAKTLAKYIVGPENTFFDGSLNLSSNISGSLNDPLINVSMIFKDIAYNDYKIGSVLLHLDYEDELLRSDIQFVDTTGNILTPLLTMSGTLPIKLGMDAKGNRIPADEDINFKVASKTFNLVYLGSLIPFVSDQYGDVTIDLLITGTLNNLKYDGIFNLKNGWFHFDPTNLNYKLNCDIAFKDQRIDLTGIRLENTTDTKYNGVLDFTGSIGLKGFSIDNMEILTKGDLSVVGNITKAAIPFFYGDLFIGTGDGWRYTYNGEKSFFKGDIILKYTNLTYSLSTETGISTGDFIYNIITDTSKINKEDLKYDKIVNPLIKSGTSRESETASASNLDYDINIKMEKDAIMNFILAQAWNQKLYIEAFGDLHYESINGFTNTQGEIQIRDDSRLEFLKSFEADGILRFESDITNPYLDIIATYTGEWDDANGITQDVAVKIKLSGTVKDLSTNLINNPNNISVYVGRRNIDSNIPDPRYDVSNAFAFILIGELDLNNLTSSQRSQIAGQTSSFGANTAASFMGQLLSGFLNSYVGDIVRSIQITQSGFSVTGRFQNFRYTFGYNFAGAAQQQQDISMANFKLEYLWTRNLLLRLERRKSIVQSFGSNEQINEFGIKYKFEF